MPAPDVLRRFFRPLGRPASLLLVLTSLAAPSAGVAQTAPRALAEPDPADVATPEAVVEALYAAIQRAPGENYDWDRFLSLFLPGAILVPNTEQTGGETLVHSPREFMERVAGFTTVGGPSDLGFQEEQIAAVVERYGDVAHVFSTYQKHLWEQDEILGRGVNSIQLVHADGRWWVSGIVWDEEIGAGPLPPAYLPAGG